MCKSLCVCVQPQQQLSEYIQIIHWHWTEAMELNGSFYSKWFRETHTSELCGRRSDQGCCCSLHFWPQLWIHIRKPHTLQGELQKERLHSFPATYFTAAVRPFTVKSRPTLSAVVNDSILLLVWFYFESETLILKLIWQQDVKISWKLRESLRLVLLCVPNIIFDMV